MMQFISKHNECEKYSQHKIYILFYIYCYFVPGLEVHILMLSLTMNKSQKQSKPPRLMMGNSNLGFCKQIFTADSKLFVFLKGIHRLIVWTIIGNHDSILALPHWKNRSENLQSPVPVFCLTRHFEWIVFGTNNNVSIGNYLGQFSLFFRVGF